MSIKKKQRRDAVDNRDAVLSAAAEVFALQGFDVPLEAIASRAGVSRTTLYRHFTDRQSLGLAIFERHLQELELLVVEVRDRADGLFIVLDALLAHFASSAGLADVISRKSDTLPQLFDMHARAVRALTPLLHKAQAAGLIRPDLLPADLGLLLDIFSAALGDGDVGQRRQRAGRLWELLRLGIVMR